MTDESLQPWTADELRERGVGVGVARSGRLLRVDCRTCDHLIDDAFVSRLEGHPSLRELYLAGSAIGDRSLESLLRLQALRTLDVQNTQLTGGAIARLAELPALELFLVRGTGISATDLADLRRRCIRTRIVG